MTNEIWVDITGFEDIYKVSNHGRVMSCARTVPDKRTGTKVKKARLLKLTVDTAGYQRVKLYRNETEWEVWKVHRLVATFFCASHVGCDVVNHIDNNKTNNVATNLEWTTPKGNNEHMIAQGRIRPPKGEASGTAKLTEEDVRVIRAMSDQGIAQHILGSQFGITQQQVSKIIRGQRWAHI